jgi:hypothetical protein
MPSYNGRLSETLIKGSSTGGEFAVLTGVSTASIVPSVPAKYLDSALFAVESQGVSGTFSAHVISRIGGATFVIAGVTGIAADGSSLMGLSTAIVGVPRPSYVEFGSAEDGSGFTASVHMAGEY